MSRAHGGLFVLALFFLSCVMIRCRLRCLIWLIFPYRWHIRGVGWPICTDISIIMRVNVAAHSHTNLWITHYNWMRHVWNKKTHSVYGNLRARLVFIVFLHRLNDQVIRGDSLELRSTATNYYLFFNQLNPNHTCRQSACSGRTATWCLSYCALHFWFSHS